MQSTLLQLSKPRDYCETEEKIEKTTSIKYNLETESIDDDHSDPLILSKS